MAARAGEPGARKQSRQAVGMILDLRGKVVWASQRRGEPDLLDSLYPADALKVGEGATLVLVYFKGCRQETIAGKARVKVGKEAGVIDKPAALSVGKTQCEPPGLQLPAQAGGMPQALTLMGPGKEAAETEANYKAAIAKSTQAAAPRLGYAVFLENRGRPAEAVEQYKELMRMYPQSASLRRRYAQVLDQAQP